PSVTTKLPLVVVPSASRYLTNSHSVSSEILGLMNGVSGPKVQLPGLGFRKGRSRDTDACSYFHNLITHADRIPGDLLPDPFRLLPSTRALGRGQNQTELIATVAC